MSAGVVVVEGLGLHTGARGRVTLRAEPGPVTLDGIPIDLWKAVRAERSTKIVSDEREVRTVEHLFSALAGLGVYDGAAIEAEGDELPILDGASRDWARAVAALEIAPQDPLLRVIAAGEVEVGRSRYTFAPGEEVRVKVETDLGDDRLAKEASWDGDAADYRGRIAVARTFAFAGEVGELAARGLARHVPPESVVVIGETILAAGNPFEADEPARHKLLDLMGDLYLYGGPPLGEVTAYRPGHWSTHEAMKLALERGLVARG